MMINTLLLIDALKASILSINNGEHKKALLCLLEKALTDLLECKYTDSLDKAQAEVEEQRKTATQLAELARDWQEKYEAVGPSLFADFRLLFGMSPHTTEEQMAHKITEVYKDHHSNTMSLPAERMCAKLVLKVTGFVLPANENDVPVGAIFITNGVECVREQYCKIAQHYQCGYHICNKATDIRGQPLKGHFALYALDETCAKTLRRAICSPSS